MVIIISCLRAFVVSVLKGNSYAFELVESFWQYGLESQKVINEESKN